MKTNPSSPTADAIGAALRESDDFGHELRVKADLERAGGRVVHGWSYIDPREQKPRQFDLRATFCSHDSVHRLQLAIECKNLSPESPLVVSGVKRSSEEAFHDFVVADSTSGHDRRYVMRSRRDALLYPPYQFVGKSQVRLRPGRGDELGRLVSSSSMESDVYARWSQCLASADQLCKDAIVPRGEKTLTRTLVLPMFVVPDGSLWCAAYEHGDIVDLRSSRHLHFFVNHEVTVVPHNHWMNLSHVHFVTVTGLREFLARLELRPAPWSDWFPDSAERHTVPVH